MDPFTPPVAPAPPRRWSRTTIAAISAAALGLLTIGGLAVSGIRDQGGDGISGCFVAGKPLAGECLEGNPPLCPRKDGQPNGWPCIWVDPQTHELYYVDSRAYRNQDTGG